MSFCYSLFHIQEGLLNHYVALDQGRMASSHWQCFFFATPHALRIEYRWYRHLAVCFQRVNMFVTTPLLALIDKILLEEIIIMPSGNAKFIRQRLLISTNSLCQNRVLSRVWSSRKCSVRRFRTYPYRLYLRFSASLKTCTPISRYLSSGLYSRGVSNGLNGSSAMIEGKQIIPCSSAA